MKIGIFSPYLPKHYGGGEKHILTCAEILSQNHDVDILVPTNATLIPEQIARYESLFALNLQQVRWKPSPLADRSTNPIQSWNLTKQYDVFLYASDGSFFFCGAPHSILHVQIPFQNQLSWLQKRKLASWTVLNTNSQFTAQVIERSWQRAVDAIHYPYVDTRALRPSFGRKQKTILAVGRFYDPEHTDVHAKRQDILVDAFLEGCRRFNWQETGWKLQLVGSVEPDSVHQKFVDSLRQKAHGFPIEFHHDISADQLDELYQQSTVFWHAAGLGIDETKHPEKVEHFGMAIIEAMARGAIPVVVGKGGVTETVENGVSGFYFADIAGLIEHTQAILAATPTQRQPWQDAARIRAEAYSKEQFATTLNRMLPKQGSHP